MIIDTENVVEGALELPHALSRLEWKALMYGLLTTAEKDGYIIEVERAPLTPLAMKHDAPVVRVWERKG